MVWRMGTSRTELGHSLTMATTVYVESSIISYLTARPSRDVVVTARQAITIEWWNVRRSAFGVFISVLVEEEIAAGDPEAARMRIEAVAGIPGYAITEHAQALATRLITEKAIPRNNIEDALHIAIAATQGADFLLTWNFKHINNAETKALIARVVEAAGYTCPVLCSPEELGGSDEV
jgi:hypothetical protein